MISIGDVPLFHVTLRAYCDSRAAGAERVGIAPSETAHDPGSIVSLGVPQEKLEEVRRAFFDPKLPACPCGSRMGRAMLIVPPAEPAPPEGP